MRCQHGITGRVSTMNMPAARDELVATLEETLRPQQRLVDDVRDEALPVADLVAQVTVLERLDDRRDRLIGQLRRTASAGMRPARTSPPVREVLLETLADFRWPQNAGFLEEYLLAKHQLQLDSRAFAPLRRDERNAWDRAPGAREAYIAPALKPDGSRAGAMYASRAPGARSQAFRSSRRRGANARLSSCSWCLASRYSSRNPAFCGQRKSARVSSRTSRTGGLVRAGRIPALAVRLSWPISRSRRSSSRSSTVTCATRSATGSASSRTSSTSRCWGRRVSSRVATSSSRAAGMFIVLTLPVIPC